MNVGLPGTGIGGIFYFLTVIIILFDEIFKTFKRKSSRKRWVRVLEQLFVALLMLTIAILMNTVVSYFIHKPPIPVPPDHSPIQSWMWYIIQSHPLVVPIALLLLVLSFVEIAYIYFRIKDRKFF